jgi:hypothetical protein
MRCLATFEGKLVFLEFRVVYNKADDFSDGHCHGFHVGMVEGTIVATLRYLLASHKLVGKSAGYS